MTRVIVKTCFKRNRELTIVGHFDTPLSVMVRTIRIVSKSTKK